jgi:hypothetical protein
VNHGRHLDGLVERVVDAAEALSAFGQARRLGWSQLAVGEHFATQRDLHLHLPYQE